jgi:hypothetical protein
MLEENLDDTAVSHDSGNATESYAESSSDKEFYDDSDKDPDYHLDAPHDRSVDAKGNTRQLPTEHPKQADLDGEMQVEGDEGTCLKMMLKRQMAGLTVAVYQPHDGNKRQYRKYDYCLYCEGSFTSKISVHYTNIHSNEEDVKKALLLPIHTRERKAAFQNLQNKGNFLHNAKCIEIGEGELAVVRRPTENRQAHEFLPCEFCLGFYLHESLWLHIKTCQFNKTEG